MFGPSTKVVVSTKKKYYSLYIRRMLAKTQLDHLLHERFSPNGMSKYRTQADKCKRSIMKYQASKKLKLTTNKDYERAFFIKYLHSKMTKSNTIPTFN